MDIAHIGNVAGIGSTLAEEQRRMGLDTKVFVFDEMTKKMFGGTMINYNSFLEKVFFLIRLKFYDIWHYHYPYGGLNSYLKKNFKDRVFLKHYHGSDIRGSGKIDLDFCLVSTPDLLKYVPNGEWLPTPINLAKIHKFIKTSNNKSFHSPIRIAHYPYYSNKPEWDYFSHVFSAMEKRNQVQIIKIFQSTYDQSLKSISECDLVVGKILPEMGWIGKIELEAMALGKPVIAYISDELYEKYKPPVYRTTKETLEKDLTDLILDDSVQKRLSEKGPPYVRKYHDSSIISDKVLDYYSVMKERS